MKRDENGLTLTGKITTYLRKMASIQWSFFRMKYTDIQQFRKQNSHLRVICRLGLQITSKKKRIFAVVGLKNSRYEKQHTYYLYASGNKFCRDFGWLW